MSSPSDETSGGGPVEAEPGDATPPPPPVPPPMAQPGASAALPPAAPTPVTPPPVEPAEPVAPAAPAAPAPSAHEPPPSSSAAGRAIPPDQSSNPINLLADLDPGQSRLWGIPFLGVFVRLILLIPVAFVLFILALIVSVLFLVSWIPILFEGRQAGFVYRLVGGTLRVSMRMTMYTLLMTGRYPGFTLDNADHAVRLTFDEWEPQNRLWGIPFVGVLIRLVLLIPHFLALWLLGIAVVVVAWVAWLPILINGRQADDLVRFTTGVYRWTARVSAYALLLTGTYPPFRLSA